MAAYGSIELPYHGPLHTDNDPATHVVLPLHTGSVWDRRGKQIMISTFFASGLLVMATLSSPTKPVLSSHSDLDYVGVHCTVLPFSKSWETSALNCQVDSDESYGARMSCSLDEASVFSRAWYSSSLVATAGWYTLNVDAKVGADTAGALVAGAYAAGLAEGIVSCQQILQFAFNSLVASGYGPGLPPPPSLRKYMSENDAWVREQVALHADADDYWLAVAQIIAQFDGILDGLNERSTCSSTPGFAPLSASDFLLVQANGDLFDLNVALPKQNDDDEFANDHEVALDDDDTFQRGGLMSGKRQGMGSSSSVVGYNGLPRDGGSRCSALFKFVPGAQDIFFAHTTWDDYVNAAPRTFKSVSMPIRRQNVKSSRGGSPQPRYRLNVDDVEARQQQHTQAAAALGVEQNFVTFSSSPGLVASVDDFYLVGGTSRLTVIETSLNVMNESAYHPWVNPHGTLLSWVRNVVANRLAANGAGWVDLMTRFESGTYPNQWMILDAERFSPEAAARVATAATESDGPTTTDYDATVSSSAEVKRAAEAVAGLFTVLEEAPGLVHAEDQTSTLLKKGYWGSYNVAFYEDIRTQLNDTDPYFDCPRAKLFASLQDSVVDLISMQATMTWNDYKDTPSISRGDPGNAIMARDDLRPKDSSSYKLHGGLDTKISSLKMSRSAETLGNRRTSHHLYASSGKHQISQEHQQPQTYDPLVSSIRAGMTYDPLPPFCWDQSLDDDPKSYHQGHPKCFEYEFQFTSPFQLM